MGEVSSVNDLVQKIRTICTGYGADANKVVAKVLRDAGKQGRDKVEGASPVDNGMYRRGWKLKVTKGETVVGATIYNEPHYRVTHLLEYGHALPQGGRAKAYPHIAPTRKWLEEEVERRLERELGDLE